MPLTVQHVKSDTIADFTGTVTVNNSSGGTNTVAATNLVRPSDWNSVHAATFNVAATDLFSQGFYEPFLAANTNSTMSSVTNNSFVVDPFVLPYGIGSGQINFLASASQQFVNGQVYSAASSGSNTRYQTWSTQVAIYKLGSGASTTRLESIWSVEVSQLYTWERRISGSTTSNLTVSNYLNISFPSQFDASGGITYSSTSTSGSTSVGASTGASTLADNIITNVAAYIAGQSMNVFPFATTLPPGHYYMAIMWNATASNTAAGPTTLSGGTAGQTMSFVCALEFANRSYKGPGKSTTNTSSALPSFHGFFATTTTSPPATIATSDIRNIGGLHRRYWNYMQTSY
jgi:hypothetical protein